ncbi:MAG: DNA polymerase III subunit gamma/tau C-terminal domain-containing protein [Thiohalobacterales bacterium]|nr:DNA polymerase III subunit gamma/tau C-terminal domain-containing protein [Thiohalobacterales bacterium]
MALNCACHGIEDDRIRLSIDAAHVHLLSKSRQQQLEQALARHFGRSLKLVIDTEAAPGVESPAMKKSRENAERQQQAVQAIENDTNVKALQDAFGGTVFTESIRPND